MGFPSFMPIDLKMISASITKAIVRSKLPRFKGLLRDHLKIKSDMI